MSKKASDNVDVSPTVPQDTAVAAKPEVGIVPVQPTQPNAPRVQLTASRSTRGGLMPTTFDELWRLSVVMSKSGLVPAGLSKPEQVFTAIQLGLEVGLSPMQALQGIAVINGRPSIYGDAAMGLVRGSGLCESIIDEKIIEEGKVVGYRCIGKRVGQDQPIVNEFTLDMAKRANLIGKTGPWTQYPERMLEWRARSWTLRDGWADVLKGLAIREEVEDIPPAVALSTEAKTSQLKDRLQAIKVASGDAAVEVQTQPVEVIDVQTGEVTTSAAEPVNDEDLPELELHG